MRKKLIGDKAFYKMVLAIAVPIMIQNGITNFVNLLDNIMVGRVGTEQMSGGAIVKVSLVLSLQAVMTIRHCVIPSGSSCMPVWHCCLWEC